MRSLDSVFGIAGTALNAQTIRLNTTASNLANATTMAGSDADAFRAKRPVFKALINEEMTNRAFPNQGGVKVDQIVDDPTPIRSMYDPSSHCQVGWLARGSIPSGSTKFKSSSRNR